MAVIMAVKVIHLFQYEKDILYDEKLPKMYSYNYISACMWQYQSVRSF